MQIRSLALGSVVIAAAVGNLMAGGGAAPSYSSMPTSGGKGITSGNSMGAMGGAIEGSQALGAGVLGATGAAFDSFGSSLEGALKPLWDLGTVYEGNGAVKEFGFHGRYHGQYHWSDGTGGTDDGYETRRSRIGSHLELSNGFSLAATFNIEVDDSFEVDSLYDGGLSWEGANGLNFFVGKLKPRITGEYSVSSKRILTVERSLLVNQVFPTTTGGVMVGGETGNLDWELYGLFGGAEGDLALPTVDGGFNVLANLSYDVSETTSGHIHYLWHEDDADNKAFADYDHVFSIGRTTKGNGAGLMTDLIYASGDSDAYGVMIMPYYDLSDSLRLVVRGQYAASDSDDGLRLQKRYERTVADDDAERGDSYWAAYVGLNYYIMGDKLKIMNGFEYSDLSGGSEFDGWTFFTGLRMYF